jgi:hypothetical protein
MGLMSTAGTLGESLDMKLCKCGHVRGIHFRGYQCQAEYCDCCSFDTSDSQPMTEPSRWPEGAEI